MSSRQARWTFLLAVAICTAQVPAASAGEVAIDPDRSIFAVITHKAGIAARLAHDHLVVAVSPSLALDFDPQQPAATRFTFVTRVAALEVDPPAARAAWKQRLEELAIHSGDLPPVPDSDRSKVRAAMLGASQLDAARFPEIRAEVLRIESRASSPQSPGTAESAAPVASAKPGDSDGEAVVRITIHGRTVDRLLQARWSGEKDVLVAEVFGEFHFSEFGIEPYSAMLGAVRNADNFHIYVRIQAQEEPAEH